MLALEYFRQLCSNFGLVIRSFDLSQYNGENFVVRLLAAVVRIAAEDPTLIGLGKQSTIPVYSGREARQDEIVSIEAQGVGGGGLASISSADASVTGISLDFSTMERRLLDCEVSASIPPFPKTYLYALILECISSICEGLSKFIMPLSVSSRHLQSSELTIEEDGEDSTADSGMPSDASRRSTTSHKYQRLANPLKMFSLPQLTQVQACSTMIDRCWPAILATCSTFLNTALDSHFYHVLIRSMQKLAQVSGTLELSTPRDALLTSLAKGSVPPNSAAIIAMSQTTAEHESSRSVSLNGLKSPTAETQRTSLPTPVHSLNVRHLLCLRALLNLGIALGPTLAQESWFVIIETLQQVETLMSVTGASRAIPREPTSKAENGSQEGQISLAGEMSAVNATTKRMFESTRSYTDESFAAIAHSLLRMAGEIQGDNSMPQKELIVQSPATLSSPTILKRSHQASRSVSGLWAKTKALDVEVAFVLTRTKDLTRVNLQRFASVSSTICTWDLIVSRLLRIVKSSAINPDLRLQAASIADLIAIEVMKLLNFDMLNESEVNQIQCRCLDVLAIQVSWDASTIDDGDQAHGLREELYKRVFEALENILGHNGESLQKAWEVVFTVLNAGVVFGQRFANAPPGHDEVLGLDPSKVTPVAFRCIQLICNDFVPLLNVESLKCLIELLFSFGAQISDLNMSLTTTGLLRSVASLLETRTGTIDILREGFSQLSLGQVEGVPKLADYLWSLTVTQLRQMCSDTRADVRDASVRILLQVIESASEKLTPKSLALALDIHLFSVMRGYQEIIAQSSARDPAYSTSLAKLIEGLTNLMIQSMDHLITDTAFIGTWELLLRNLSDVLTSSAITLQTLIFESLIKLLGALRVVSTDPSKYVMGTLVLWAVYDPSRGGREDAISNQDVLAAHVNMLVEAAATSSDCTTRIAPDSTQAADRVMRSIRCALLTVKHPSYTNDIRKRTNEQDAAFQALEVLRQMLKFSVERYIAFLLELIRTMLLRPAGEAAELIQQPSRSGKLQQPTYIAMASSCLGLLCQTIRDKANPLTAWTPTQLQNSFQVLSFLINTKYTSIPTNPDAPLWRSATTTAVIILEATSSFNPPLQTALTPEQTADLNASITACLTSIIGRGGLESYSPPPSPEIIAHDETFDIAHLQRFHATALPLLSLTAAISEQRRQYVLVLFHASLVAKPWFFDFPLNFPHDISTSPLKDLMTLRKGSVHPPQFPRRSRIPYAALDALFDIIDPTKEAFEKAMAGEAAAYLLLRIAHSMKVFLADQPLRGLTPLPMQYQEELRWMLERCLATRVDDECFEIALRRGNNGRLGAENGKPGRSAGLGVGDGKSHLRILFRLVLKMQKGWRSMMRLPDGKGWQDDVVGEEIERALEAWVESIGEEWGLTLGN